MKLGKDIPISKDCVLCICKEGKLWLDGKDVTKFYASMGITTKEAIERFADDKQGYLKALKLDTVKTIAKEKEVVTEKSKFVKKADTPIEKKFATEVVWAEYRKAGDQEIMVVESENVLS